MQFKYFFICLLLTGSMYASDAKLSKKAQLPPGTIKFIKTLYSKKCAPSNDGTYGHVALHKIITILYTTGRYSSTELDEILLTHKPDSGNMRQWVSDLNKYLVKNGLISEEVKPKDEVKVFLDVASLPYKVELNVHVKKPAKKEPNSNINLINDSDYEMPFLKWSVKNKKSLHDLEKKILSGFYAQPIGHTQDRSAQNRPRTTSPIIDPSVGDWYKTTFAITDDIFEQERRGLKKTVVKK